MLGVVATNALELGVDIGQLGAAVIAGYPGTIASLWQQAGRAGRRSEISAAVLVASGAPLDQFVAANPRYLFEQPPEHGLIHPDNLAILLRHLRCAAFELPFEGDESFGSFTKVGDLLDFLAQEGELHPSSGAYRWVGDSYPAEAVSLRASSDDTIFLWETDPWELRARLAEHEDGVRGIAFSPTGDVLASASHDGTVRLWEASTGDPIGSPLD